MSKATNQYRYIVIKRSRDSYNYIGEDVHYEVTVKADSIEEAEKKAKEVGEVKTVYNPDRYIYKIELLEIEEL